MFSFLSSKNRSGKAIHGGNARERKSDSMIRTSKKKSLENDEESRAAALDRTEVRESKYKFPSERMAMSDRLDSHNKGSLFKYAVISTKPPKSRSFIMDRLRTYSPPNEHVNVRLDDIPPLLLNREYNIVDLTEAISKKSPGLKKPFCMVSDIFIHYVPMDTFLTTQSTVEVMLTDERKSDDNVIRHASLSSNAGYNVLFTLDYCVETADLSNLKLSITRHVSNFKAGKSWAMCKVLIGLDFFDVARRANLQESLAVAQFADTDLIDFVTDPRGIDSVITPESLRQLRLLHKSGDIENLTEPKNDQKRIETAATIIGQTGNIGDAEPLDVVTLMKARVLEASRVKEERKNAVVPKSALKASVPKVEDSLDSEEPALDAEDSVGQVEDLKEIEMGEHAPGSICSDPEEESDHDEIPFVTQFQKKPSVGFVDGS